MSRPLRTTALAMLLAGALGGAWAQTTGIYTCIDAKGRRLTSDRPILECVDREQKELNASGTVKRIVPPSLTGPERAALEERERKLAEERQRQEEDKRMRRALLTRYPNPAVHDAEREKALKTASDAITSGQRRIAELHEERKKLATEAEFYKDPAKWPAKLKRQVEQNEQETASQQRYIVTQQEEKKRIDKRFDEELERLKVLWAQAQGTTAASAAPASVPVRR
jgi:hypothetical protein